MDRLRDRMRKQRQERLRREKHERTLPAPGSTEPGFVSPEREAGNLLRFRQGPRRGEAAGPTPPGPAEEAAELALEARGCSTPDEALRQARHALALDPGCVDALVIVAELGSPSLEALAAGLDQAVRAGRRALGEARFQERDREFWVATDTRPYLRARLKLAGALARLGRAGEAVTHYEDLLALDPSDHQGAREELLALYLRQGSAARARALMARYPERHLAAAAWAEVLLFLLEGDEPGAAGALAHARSVNPHAEPLLTGAHPLPRERPTFYAPGDRNEAVCCAATFVPAWEGHPEARAWLRAASTSGRRRRP